MNRIHLWYCNSDGWARTLQGRVMPWVLDDVNLGDDVLEIGPGPGRGTEWLMRRVPKLTSLEIDHALAASLKERMADTNVTVVEGDGTNMSLPDESFSGAVSFTMLHHVPSPELQDRLLAETFRVLKPGGMLAGADSVPSFLWNVFHLFDIRVPIDPDTFGGRLEKAGFEEVRVDRARTTCRFYGKKPA
jgi:ubiquinone/menaquinone biosynthesis C-methylase UbiE